VQFGAALATRLFGRVGPAGAVTLRLVVGAVILLAVVRRGPGTRPGSADRTVVAAFGLVLAAMNLSFYEAIARIPLGVAVTIEFSGPLALALSFSRRWTDGLWAAGAGTGVALLAVGAGRGLDPSGLLFAVVAGALWAAYILLSRETGRRFESVGGLAWAMLVGAVVVLPIGVAAGGSALVRPSVLVIGAAVGLLSSVVPYSLELVALRRVTPRAFGVMLSMEPALAAAAGFAVLGQHLALREWVALALVVAANLGNSLVGRPAVTPGTS
jgi:inner membrane transporter RhtA